jgi:hypothetical protein
MEETVFKKLLIKILSDRFDKDFDKRMRTHKLIVYLFLISSLFLIHNSLALVLIVSLVAVIILVLASKTVATQLEEETETTLDNVLALFEDNKEPISETEILWKIANREI